MKNVPWTKVQPLVLSLLRAVSGLLLFQAGAMKTFGWLGGMPNGQKLEVGSQLWIGGWLETVCGALLLVGLLTRPAAFLMSGTMAVAYFQFHQPQGTWPAQNGGGAAVTLCFMCLAVWAYGPGPLSVDALLKKQPLPDSA